MATFLGNFRFLPFEIRELIWLNFLPCGEDGYERHTHKTDLSILRASHAIYEEVSSILYKNSRLEIELSPFPDEWMTIKFSTHHYQLTTAPKTKWVIGSVDDARGLHDLPFRRMNEIVVNLCAPMSENPGQLYILFDKVVNLVELLRKAPAIRKLKIMLKEQDDQEWHHFWLKGVQGEDWGRLKACADDCDIMVVPFCSLRNIENISVHAHSEKLEKSIEWTVINWTVGVVRDRSWETYISDPTRTNIYSLLVDNNLLAGPDRTTPETDIDRKIAEYYLRIHIALWLHDEHDTARHIRRDILKQSFTRGTTDLSSPFECDMLYIARKYPDLVKIYNESITLLSEIQRIVVRAYDRTKPGGLACPDITTITTPDINWDRAAWKLLEDIFVDPLPMLGGKVFRECADELGSRVDYNECLDRVEELDLESGLNLAIVRMGLFLRYWVRENVYSQGADEEDEDGYIETSEE